MTKFESIRHKREVSLASMFVRGLFVNIQYGARLATGNLIGLFLVIMLAVMSI